MRCVQNLNILESTDTNLSRLLLVSLCWFLPISKSSNLLQQTEAALLSFTRWLTSELVFWSFIASCVHAGNFSSARQTHEPTFTRACLLCGCSNWQGVKSFSGSSCRFDFYEMVCLLKRQAAIVTPHFQWCYSPITLQSHAWPEPVTGQ